MMKLRRTLCFVVAISIVFGCVGMVAAEDVPKVAAVERATGSFKTTVKPGVIAKRTTKLPLEAGEEVTIKATYSPYSVSVDVGLIDSDGIFHFITVSDGIIDEKIAVTERGNYTFAIRNNGSVDIEVSGYVNYETIIRYLKSGRFFRYRNLLTNRLFCPIIQMRKDVTDEN